MQKIFKNILQDLECRRTGEWSYRQTFILFSLFFSFKREKGDKDARLTEIMQDLRIEVLIRWWRKLRKIHSIKKEISGERYISAFPCSDTMIKWVSLYEFYS
jgi:hypothetical protein